GFTPPDVLWTRLQKRTCERSAIRKQITWSIAASVLILIISVFIFLKPDTQGDNVSMTEENIVLDYEHKAIKYINALCERNNAACASSAFTELKNDLEESTSMLNKIDRQISLFGNDEELLRARSRIENHQARLIKEMIQTL